MTAAEPEPLRFYFDFISPYAYLGWTQVYRLEQAVGRTVQPVPVLFAAMLNHWGHKGPAEIPPKRDHLYKNVVRIAHDLGVPVAPPPAHPFNPVLALRIAALPHPRELQRKIIDRLFEMAWVTREGVTDAARVASALDELGVAGASLVAAASADAHKAHLKTMTADAIAAGVFGVPTVIVDGELFWGVDSFAHIDRFMRNEDPVDGDSLAIWRNLPASATR